MYNQYSSGLTTLFLFSGFSHCTSLLDDDIIILLSTNSLLRALTGCIVSDWNMFESIDMWIRRCVTNASIDLLLVCDGVCCSVICTTWHPILSSQIWIVLMIERHHRVIMEIKRLTVVMGLLSTPCYPFSIN